MSFPRYPEYKDSGVEWLGEVPAHWKTIRLKHVLDFATGWTPPTNDSSSFEGENLWANISDLGERVIYNTVRRISDDAVALAGIAPVEAGSLLYSFKLSIGQVSFAGQKMYTNEAIAAFSPSESLDLRYAYYALPLLLERNASENIYGAKLLNQTLIKSAQLVLPPVGEQGALANFLDRETAKIDALVAEQERLIALLQEKRQAVISHAVTKGLNPDAPMKDSGMEWLGEVPAHWLFPSVAERYIVELGKMLDESRETGEFLTPYLRNANVQWDSLSVADLDEMDIKPDERERYLLEVGDLLVCEGGEVGRAALWTGDVPICGYQKALHRLRPRRPTEVPRFMLYTLRHVASLGVFTALGNQSTIVHLTAQQLRRYRFPAPPKEEQEAIVKSVDEMMDKLDSTMAAAVEVVQLLSCRRASLITAAVTGRIDVRDLAISDAS